MAIRNIRKKGDDILRKVSRPVENINDNIITLLDDMRDTMEESNGVGLAAVQVGALRRVVIVEDGEELVEMINPEIIAMGDKVQEEIEGCLSVPGQAGVVPRPTEVTIKAQNREGEWFEITGHDRVAIAFCHELDHLDGVLYTDKVLYMVDEEGEPIN